MVPDPRTAGLSTSRRATEEILLDALEVVLLRDGLRNLAVNAIVDQAGVGKPLLYRYFGDLPGLVRAWGGAPRALGRPVPPGRSPQPAGERRPFIPPPGHRRTCQRCRVTANPPGQHRLMGLRLDTEAGWNDAMAMIREIADLAVPDVPPPTPAT